MRNLLIAIATVGLLAGCTTPNDSSSSNSQQSTTVSRLTERDVPEIQFRQLDTINALRQNAGLGSVALSAELTAAAKTHALDISRQNRPWHFGSNGSSPIDRAAQAGYVGTIVGENLSESFEDDLTTLRAWMENPNNSAIIMDPNAAYMGIAWHQEPNGKMWWVQVIGK